MHFSQQFIGARSGTGPPGVHIVISGFLLLNGCCRRHGKKEKSAIDQISDKDYLAVPESGLSGLFPECENGALDNCRDLAHLLSRHICPAKPVNLFSIFPCMFF